MLRAQKIRSSNTPVVTGICDPNKSRARDHRSLKLGSKLKYLNNFIVAIVHITKFLSNVVFGRFTLICWFFHEFIYNSVYLLVQFVDYRGREVLLKFLD